MKEKLTDWKNNKDKSSKNVSFWFKTLKKT